jgi:phosphatidate cytidylyltransferase
VTETPQPKKSDLGVRVLSAIAMIAVAGTALWLGGWAWTLFVAAVGLGVLWEWWGLVSGFVKSAMGRTAWLIGGSIYVGLAANFLVELRNEDERGWIMLVLILLGVIGTDVGAYFAGRAIGGPKIAPQISPSKTWAGLLGGIIGASVVMSLWFRFTTDPFFANLTGSDHSVIPSWPHLTSVMLFGTLLAVISQAGDFFESWMKRKAGVKDSGNLIPGHGGLLDRADGLIAVCFVGSIVPFVARLFVP